MQNMFYTWDAHTNSLTINTKGIFIYLKMDSKSDKIIQAGDIAGFCVILWNYQYSPHWCGVKY